MIKIKTLGLALLAVCALGLVATASSWAAPVWEQETLGIWSEIKAKTNLLDDYLWTLTDEGTGVELECEGYEIGTLGPGSSGEITGEHTSKCIVLKGTCASGTASAVDLPWKLKLVLAGTEFRNEIENGGSGEPGWSFVCGGVATDTCTGKTSTAMTNLTGVGKIEALFDAKSPKSNCSVGGAGKGRILGFDIILLESGKPLRMK